ncbi:hypothetical protein CBL_06182 [Carabus blaptoides fortunei]
MNSTDTQHNGYTGRRRNAKSGRGEVAAVIKCTSLAWRMSFVTDLMHGYLSAWRYSSSADPFLTVFKNTQHPAAVDTITRRMRLVRRVCPVREELHVRTTEHYVIDSTSAAGSSVPALSLVTSVSKHKTRA